MKISRKSPRGQRVKKIPRKLTIDIGICPRVYIHIYPHHSFSVIFVTRTRRFYMLLAWYLFWVKDKSMLGRVAPLGWPKSVYKSYVEHWTLEYWVKKAKWPCRSNSWPPFSIPAERILRFIFGANLVMVAQIHYDYHADKSNFLEFWVKVAKMTSNTKVNETR